MVSKWSAERVWESTYDLRSEATVQVKEQQNPQLYSAARPTGAKNKKQSRGSYPFHQAIFHSNQITMCSPRHTRCHLAHSQ